jgi:hypothetical protein
VEELAGEVRFLARSVAPDSRFERRAGPKSGVYTAL